MKIPRWYKFLAFLWFLIVAPFWWFAAAFNGESFFSIPQFSGPSEGAGWQLSLLFQLLMTSAFLVPPILLPFVLIQAKRATRDSNAAD